MIDCLTTEEMVQFISVVDVLPDVVAFYLDGMQIDIGPTSWRWVEYLGVWVHGGTPSCVKGMGV